MVYLLLARMKKINQKWRRWSAHKILPIITSLDLSVAIETRVLIRSGLKPHAAFYPIMMLQMKFNFNRPVGLRDIHV